MLRRAALRRTGTVTGSVTGRVAALVVAALAVSGCATMFGGYDLAPNGMTRDEDAFRRAMAVDATRAYRDAVDGQKAIPEDDLLRLLYAGMAGRHAGALDESSRLLDVASWIADDRVTMSLSRELLSFVTSDRSLAYTPGVTERLMIPYTAALNYLDLGDLDAAAVEARRIEAVLDQRYGDRAPADRPADNRFLHYFAGSVFHAAGDANAADVSFRRGDRIADAHGARAAPLQTVADAGRGAGAGPGAGDVATDGVAVATDGMGEVVVLVEHGFVPHRVEQSVVIVLPPEQVRMLTEGSAGERTLAAAEAAARILISAAILYGDRSGYYRDRGFQTAVHLEPWSGDRCRDGQWGGEGGGRCAEASGKPYLLRISWPVLYHDPAPLGALRVRAGTVGADPVARFDVAAGVRSDFDDGRAANLTRTVARAASKLALSAGVERTVARHDAGAGQVAGLLTNLTTLLSERADTRSWHLLPGSVSMVRLRLPAGTHDLTLETGQGRPLALGTVNVAAGETAFLSTRVWR